jgi:hypothetical protein
VQALAGDALGFAAASFHALRLVCVAVHVPPSLFRPLHYLLLERLRASPHPAADGARETLTLAVRATALLTPLLLGIPLAVVSQWLRLARASAADGGGAAEAREHAATAAGVFFAAPLALCMLTPTTPAALWARYVGFMVSYYAPLAWRLLYESCLLEPADSWLRPRAADGDLLGAAGSWARCFALTWWPQTAAAWRSLVGALAATFAEILLVTIIVTSLMRPLLAGAAGAKQPRARPPAPSDGRLRGRAVSRSAAAARLL